jgi:zinc transporter ZupT
MEDLDFIRIYVVSGFVAICLGVMSLIRHARKGQNKVPNLVRWGFVSGLVTFVGIFAALFQQIPLWAAILVAVAAGSMTGLLIATGVTDTIADSFRRRQ